MLVQSLGPENPLEKDMAIHSSILTWEISWTAEPGRPQSTGSQRVQDDLATKEQHGPVKRGRQDSIEYGGRGSSPRNSELGVDQTLLVLCSAATLSIFLDKRALI